MISYPQVAERFQMLGFTVTEADKPAIEFEMRLILNYVINYCNFTSEADIPSILDYRIIDRICAEYLKKQKNSGNLEGFDYEGFVKTIKEGDTQIQFGNSSDGETPESRFDDLVDDMERGFDKWISLHRKLKW